MNTPETLIDVGAANWSFYLWKCLTRILQQILGSVLLFNVCSARQPDIRKTPNPLNHSYETTLRCNGNRKQASTSRKKVGLAGK